MNYFILGMGITGISTVKTLSSMGKKIYVYDEKIVDFTDIKKELKGYEFILIEDFDKFDINTIDIVIKSPGIPLNNKIVEKFLNINKEVISDLELAYRLFPEKKLISITGTNGKTTTTLLLTHILNCSGKKAMAIGNIGIGMLWEIYINKDVEYFVIECSSFQLASTSKFRTEVAGLLNITEDHVDWHGSMKEYIISKTNIFNFQNEDDILVANIDDELVKKEIKKSKSKILPISMNEVLKNGVYFKDNQINISENNKFTKVLDTKDLKIVGKHNIENSLIATGMAYSLNIDIEIIRKACISFNPVEHRIEYVRDYKNVKFYNDSKGTNIDATLKALDSFENPVILIAGGYDKKVSFDELFKNNKNIKTLILFGETSNKMKKCAKRYLDIDIFLVQNMKEAISKSVETMNADDVVLLSPANASWGMYKSYKERGKDFKYQVNNLGE